MEARLNVFENAIAMKLIKHFQAAGRAVNDSSLPETTQELVRLRTSQVNGCGVCVDMHFKEAVARGENPERLNMVAAWHDSTVFTEAERAALEVAEQGTRIADGAGGVTDEAWLNASKHFDEDQLTALVALIATMNAFNRLNVILRQPAGNYVPGMFD